MNKDQQFKQSVEKMEKVSRAIVSGLSESELTKGESVMVLTITLDTFLQTCDKAYLKDYEKIKNTMREAGILKSV